ncbi:putative esterase [Spirosoma lacussanchae]
MQNMTEHHFTVQRTARYYTLGQLTGETRHVWFCLHGFGQLARYFSRKFTDFADQETCIVVPEGLSRLYLNGAYDRVGASWLTREDRDVEIQDFLGYLNGLYDHILAGCSPETLQITLLGFSQGAATACRWLANEHIRVDRLVLWAGFFPNGFADMIDPARLTTVDAHYVYGRQDEYIRDMPDPQAYIDQIQRHAPGLRITAYEGGHRVEPAVLKEVLLSGPAY